MEYKEFSAKTVDDAITAACQDFFVTSDKLDYEVLEEGSSGFLGIGAKPALIKARVKEDKEICKRNSKGFQCRCKGSRRSSKEILRRSI